LVVGIKLTKIKRNNGNAEISRILGVNVLKEFLGFDIKNDFSIHGVISINSLKEDGKEAG